MKRFTLLLGLVCFVLLTACSTAPQVQSGSDTSKKTPGIYKNEEHGFMLDYPKHWIHQETKLPTEVVRITNTVNYNYPILAVGVSEVDKMPNLLDPKKFTKYSKDVNWPGTSRYKVVEQKDIVLDDGTPAILFAYKWTWSNGTSKLITVALVAKKNGKYFALTATGYMPGGTPLDKLYELVTGKFKFI